VICDDGREVPRLVQSVAEEPLKLIGSVMIVERVVLVPPAAPGSKGDEGMLRGALALLEGFPVRIVNPDPDPGWTSVLADAGRAKAALMEIHMPIRDYRSELRGGDLLLFIGADVVDGSCGLEPALSRIDLMADAVLHGLPVFVSCSFRSNVDRAIIQRLRLLPDIRFLIRDLHSLENFQRQTGLAAEYFPDLSFFSGAIPSPLSDEVGMELGGLPGRLPCADGNAFAPFVDPELRPSFSRCANYQNKVAISMTEGSFVAVEFLKHNYF